MFSSSFFPYTSRIWQTLDPNIHKLPSIAAFKKALLKFKHPAPSLIYEIHNFVGLKFRHKFLDTLNTLCSCYIEPETTTHYLLRCHFFSAHRKVLFDALHDIDQNMTTNITDERLTKILLYGNSSLDFEKNATLINAVIHYILSSERFNEDLIWILNKLLF